MKFPILLSTNGWGLKVETDYMPEDGASTSDKDQSACLHKQKIHLKILYFETSKNVLHINITQY